jgi:Tfp pilus assembly pilus retraction ATPase PilT
VIQMNAGTGMVTMDMSLLKLYQQKRINRQDALHYSVNPDALARSL